MAAGGDCNSRPPFLNTASGMTRTLEVHVTDETDCFRQAEDSQENRHKLFTFSGRIVAIFMVGRDSKNHDLFVSQSNDWINCSCPEYGAKASQQ